MLTFPLSKDDWTLTKQTLTLDIATCAACASRIPLFASAILCWPKGLRCQPPITLFMGIVLTSFMNPAPAFVDVDGETFLRLPPPAMPSLEDSMVPMISDANSEAFAGLIGQAAPPPPLGDSMMGGWEVVSDIEVTGPAPDSGVGSARDVAHVVASAGAAADVAASADARPRPRRRKLTVKERAANGATKIGDWNLKKVICPHNDKGFMNLWVPAKGPHKVDCEKAMSDAVNKFRKGRHNPVYFFRYLKTELRRKGWKILETPEMPGVGLKKMLAAEYGVIDHPLTSPTNRRLREATFISGLRDAD